MVRRPVAATDWNREPMPEVCRNLHLDIFYSEAEFEEIRLGLLPLQMEDKWFAYFEDPWLYLHRSWTGALIFKVRFESDNDKHRAVEAIINNTPEQYEAKSDAEESAHVEDLIRILLTSHAHGPVKSSNGEVEASNEHEALQAMAELGRTATGFRLRPGIDPYRLGTSSMTFELKRRPSDRYAGALLALACGDALGAPAEFLSKGQLKAKYGRLTEMVGGGHCQWEPGEWTDDTGMTICVARGILENPDDPIAAIGNNFLTWQETAKDVGGTIAAALNGFRARVRGFHGLPGPSMEVWAAASQNTPQARSDKAAGNGSLMRTLPIALAYPDAGAMLDTSARISAMTHWDPQAELACAIYCLWIRNLLRGAGIAEAWAEALGQGRSVQKQGIRVDETPGPEPVPDHFWPRLEGALQRQEEELQPRNGFAGYVLDCLEAVAWCCHQHKETDEVLIQTVNLGGEADTLAAIAGGVMGVANGLDGLRREWLDVLLECEELDHLGRNLAELRSEQVYAKPKLPPFTGYQASPGLFAGRNPLTDMDVEYLLRAGIRLIIDLREESEWATEGRFGAGAVAAQLWNGLERFHVPIPDGEAPSREALDRIWKILRHEAVNCLGEVYIHCRAGIERTGAALIAYVARSEGVSYEQAVGILQAHNVKISPLPNQEKMVRRWLTSAS